MRITDLLKKDGIALGVSPKSKREAIDSLRFIKNAVT